MWNATYNQPGEYYSEQVAYSGTGGKRPDRMQLLQRPYNQATEVIGIALTVRGSADILFNPVVGVDDVVLDQNGDGFSMPENAPVVGDDGLVQLRLSASEMACKRLVICFTDQSVPKQWEDEIIIIDTTLGDPPSATQIADAVWDETRSEHTVVGSFGEGIASVQGDVTGTVGSLGTTAKSDVKTQVDAQLNAALPASPTAGSAYDKLKKLSFDANGYVVCTAGASSTWVPAAAAVWNYAISSMVADATAGKVLLDRTSAASSSAMIAATKAYDLQSELDIVKDLVETQSNILSTMTEDVSSIVSSTNRIPSSPAAIGSSMTLADGAITAAKIASDAITSGKIAPGAIGASEIADGAITNAKIADGAITDAKAVSVGSVSGNISGSVNNIVEGVSLTQSTVDAVRSGLASTSDIPAEDISHISDRIDLIFGTGKAIYTHTVHQGAAPSATPLPGCLVWITSDIDGDEFVAGPQPTDEFGRTKWMLDVDSTYYVWCQKPRYTFSNPQTIQVS